MTETIVLERQDRVASLTLSSPPLNILDLRTLRKLRRCLTDLMVDPDLQILILQGDGDRAFSAGVAVEDHTPDKVPAMLAEFHGAISILREMPATTLAVVRGHCLGGGLELAAGCDLVIASEESRFGQPEVKLGCFPPLAAALYPSLLGSKHTFDLLVTGRTLSCHEALAMGLVNRAVPGEALDSAVEQLVDSILEQSMAVTRLIKRAVRAGQDHPFAEALEQCERIYLEELQKTEDMHEGLAAFVEKRRPAWKHR